MHDGIFEDDRIELTKGEAYAIIALVALALVTLIGLLVLIYLADPGLFYFY